jgi:DNA-binding transcriptional LysR family regulator
MALANVKLVQLIQRFRKANPASLVEVSNMYPSAQLTAMQAGVLDGGFIGTQPLKTIKGVAFADWGQDTLLLVLPEEHSLTRIGKLRWQHLQGLPWVMISHQEAPSYRDRLSKIIESHGLAVQIVQEANTIPTVLIMVAAGMGVAMVRQSAKHLFAPGIVFRQLPDPQPILHYVFAYRAGQDFPVLDKFLSLLRTSAQ